MSFTVQQGTPDKPAKITKKTRQPKPKKPPKKPTGKIPASADPTFLYTPYPNTDPDFDWNSIYHVPSAYSTGYDSHATVLRGKRREAALNYTNAVLSDGDFQMKVFVTNVSIDTALAGSTAQANFVRDFYPRNFVQPSFTIRGVSLDQNDYSLLCEFVQQAQRKAVSNGYLNLTQLSVYGRNPDPRKTRGLDGTRTSGRAVKLSQPGSIMKGRLRDPDTHDVALGKYLNQTVQGAHQPVLAKGYITSMPRVHEQFQYAVVWEFQYTVAAMLGGIYLDKIVKPEVQKTWQNMLADAKAQGVITGSKDLIKLNQAALKYARQNAATMFPNAQPPGNSNAGTGGSTGSGTGSLNLGNLTGVGPRWLVTCSAETNDASNGGPGCDGTPSVNIHGYSELSTNLNLDFAALGNLRCNFPMIITNPANGRSTTQPKQDNGNGSPGDLPVSGVYPGTRQAIGLDNSGSYQLIYQATNAQDAAQLRPVRGRQV